MNIAESRAPQDGRVSLSIGGRSVDFRAAVQPTIHGENFVLRVLDAKRGIVEYRKLGLTEDQYYLLDLMLARPEGIILVTGPTGSGKTTTLYSVLSHMNDESVNIMTLEDPVEYPITRIRQTSISDGSKIDFSDGVRSLMRQDPDIILVGEVRDKDTAEMAFRAAMTGHQVFSTLHQLGAAQLPAYQDLGVSPEVMAGNIIGIVAQRLVRRVRALPRGGAGHRGQHRSPPHRCPRRRAHGTVPTTAAARPAASRDKGRLAIMELLRMDSMLDELITRNATWANSLRTPWRMVLRPWPKTGCAACWKASPPWKGGPGGRSDHKTVTDTARMPRYRYCAINEGGEIVKGRNHHRPARGRPAGAAEAPRPVADPLFHGAPPCVAPGQPRARTHQPCCSTCRCCCARGAADWCPAGPARRR